MKLGEMDGESAFAFESQRMLLYDGKNRVKKMYSIKSWIISIFTRKLVSEPAMEQILDLFPGAKIFFPYSIQ